MSRRITWAIILAALGLLAYYVSQITTWREVAIPTPLKGEAAINPFYAAGKLVSELGGKSEWRRELGELPETSGILVLSGWHWDISAPRRQRIEQWVEAGGRLVVDGSLLGTAALRDWAGVRTEYFGPEYEQTEGAEAADEMQATEGKPSQLAESPSEEVAEPEPLRLPSSGRCAEFMHVESAQRDDGPRRAWTFCEARADQRFASTSRVHWGLRDDSGFVAVRVAVGKGSVSMVQGAPFVWRELQRVDHALLLLEAMHFTRGDRVQFLSADREQSLLDLAWRHGWPVVCVALLTAIVALWRNGARFGPSIPEPDPARRSLGEQILGTGRFIMRTGGAQSLHTAMLNAVEDLAARRLRDYTRLDEAARSAALADATGIDVAKIRVARDWARDSRATELAGAIACLESVRRVLLRLKFTDRKSA